MREKDEVASSPLLKENLYSSPREKNLIPLVPSPNVLFDSSKIRSAINDKIGGYSDEISKNSECSAYFATVRNNIHDLINLLKNYHFDLESISDKKRTKITLVEEGSSLEKIIEIAKKSIAEFNQEFLNLNNHDNNSKNINSSSRISITADVNTEKDNLPTLCPQVLALFEQNKIKNSQDFWHILNEKNPEMKEEDKENYILKYRNLIDKAFIHFLNELKIIDLSPEDPNYEQKMQEIIKIWDCNLDKAYKLFKEFVKIIDKKNKQYHLNIPFELDLPEELENMNILELISLFSEKTIHEHSAKTKYIAQWLTYIAYLFEVVRNLELDKKVGAVRKILNLDAVGSLSGSNNKGVMIANKKNGYDFKMQEDCIGNEEVIKELQLRKTNFPDKNKNLNFYFINLRQKSQESIVKKLIGRETSNFNDVYDHLACSFVLLNSSKEIIQSKFSNTDKELINRIDHFVKTIGTKFLGLTFTKKDRRELNNGEFMIDYDKLTENKKNKSSENYLVIKIYGKKNDVNIEVQILPMETFLANENHESPSSHEYYEDTRMLKYVNNFFPEEVFPDVQKVTEEILKHRKVRTNFRNKELPQKMIWAVNRLKNIISNFHIGENKQ